jgi:hypothetical protein
MSTKNPWFKFYPQDWRGDPKLRICSLGARGLWIEMCAVMHESDPYGHLTINDKQITDAQLSAVVGGDVGTVSTLLNELEDAGVFSRNRKGIIYSRRMVNDNKKAKTARKNGKSGGNPSLSKQRDISPLDNLPVKPQIPETRSQIKEDSKESLKKPENKHGTRIPNDWRPSAADTEYAAGKGFTDTGDLAEQFFDYWTAESGSKATKRDWSAAWRTWVRNDIKFNGHPAERTGGGRPKGGGQEPASVVAAVRKVIDAGKVERQDDQPRIRY